MSQASVLYVTRSCLSEHLRTADDAETFPGACLGVKKSPELAAQLSARAAALLVARYSPVRVDAAVAEAHGLPVVC